MHLTRKLFYRGTRRVADHEIILDMAEFFLVDKRVRDAALATKSSYPFVRGQVGYVGFKREGIPYKRERRIIGQSHYNLLGAVRFGTGGILSSSTLLLRLLAYVGAIWFLSNLGAAAVIAIGGGWLGFTLQERVVLSVLAVQLAWMNVAFGVDQRRASYPALDALTQRCENLPAFSAIEVVFSPPTPAATPA